MLQAFQSCMERCKGFFVRRHHHSSNSNKGGQQYESATLSAELLTEDGTGVSAADKEDGVVDANRVQTALSANSENKADHNEQINKKCSLQREPLPTLIVAGKGVMIFAAGLEIQYLAQWLLQAAKVPLDQNCTSIDGVPSYTLSVVAIVTGVGWVGFHVNSLRHQYRQSKVLNSGAITQVLPPRNCFEAFFKGYALNNDGPRIRTSSSLMNALAWSQLPGYLQALCLSGMPNTTLANETVMIVINQEFAWMSLVVFTSGLLWAGCSSVVVFRGQSEPVFAAIFRLSTDMMAVVSLPLLLPTYFNDLFNLINGYNSADLPTELASFVLAVPVGLLFGLRLCVPALQQNPCMKTMFEGMNVDLLLALTGAPYLLDLIGTVASCSTPSDQTQPMLTEGLGVLITALAASVLLVYIMSIIIQCCFRSGPCANAASINRHAQSQSASGLRASHNKSKAVTLAVSSVDNASREGDHEGVEAKADGMLSGV